ncbi:MAG: DUF4244 domain-containing protein [Gordonia sp. (in: high G+C Gram-positive bacteria)]
MSPKNNSILNGSIFTEVRVKISQISSATSQLLSDDEGMSTAEYAIGTIAAAAFGAILYTVISGDNIVNALTGIINKALNTAVG